MSPAAEIQKTKLVLGAHQAGVAVDGFVPESDSLERFSEELTAKLDALEAKFAEFATPASLRKSLRG
jgi:hypothetical protein